MRGQPPPHATGQRTAAGSGSRPRSGPPPIPTARVQSSVERTRRENGRQKQAAPPVVQDDSFPCFDLEGEANPAYVTAGLGRTCALPTQFEFLRADIWISRPCKNTDEAIREASAQIMAKAEEFLDEELTRAGL